MNGEECCSLKGSEAACHTDKQLSHCSIVRTPKATLCKTGKKMSQSVRRKEGKVESVRVCGVRARVCRACVSAGFGRELTELMVIWCFIAAESATQQLYKMKREMKN